MALQAQYATYNRAFLLSYFVIVDYNSFGVKISRWYIATCVGVQPGGLNVAAQECLDVVQIVSTCGVFRYLQVSNNT